MSAEPSVSAAPAKQVVAFILDAEEYAVPIGQIKEVVKVPSITLVPNGPEFVLGVMNLRGQIVPVLDLEKLFRLEPREQTPAQHVIVTEDASHTLFGIQVDRVLEVLTVAEADIKPAPKMVTSRIAADYLDGVIILQPKPGVERMLLLLNLTKIVGDKVNEPAK